MTDVLDIPPALDRRPFIGTYTNLQAYRNCEHAMYRRYVLRDQPYVESAAMKFGNEGHAAFEARVGKKIPLKSPFDQWEKHATPFDNYTVQVEQKLAIDARCRPVDFWDKDCWFRGKIDVNVALNEKALITDWKFGSSKYEDPFELATGALLLKSKYPNLRTVVGRYIYLKEDKIGQMHDLSNFKETWDEINDLMDLIAQKRKSGEWVKKKSGLCGWCSVEDCENHFVARP
jgi:hypothetical protein